MLAAQSTEDGGQERTTTGADGVDTTEFRVARPLAWIGRASRSTARRRSTDRGGGAVRNLCLGVGVDKRTHEEREELERCVGGVAEVGERKRTLGHPPSCQVHHIKACLRKR